MLCANGAWNSMLLQQPDISLRRVGTLSSLCRTEAARSGHACAMMGQNGAPKTE